MHEAASVERVEKDQDHTFPSPQDGAPPLDRACNDRSTVSWSLQGTAFVNRVNRISDISTAVSLRKVTTDDGVKKSPDTTASSLLHGEATVADVL